MNSKQFFNAMCEAMLDESWQGLIQDDYPETVDFWAPEAVGRLDAEEGLSLDPTRHGFRTIRQAEAYVIGWNAAVEVEQLIDDRLDVDFWRGGQW